MASGFFDEGQLARGSLLAHDQGLGKSTIVESTPRIPKRHKQHNNNYIDHNHDAHQEAKSEHQQVNLLLTQPIFRFSKPELETHLETEMISQPRPSRDSMRGLADGLVGMARRTLNSRASRPSTDSNTSSVLPHRVSCSPATLYNSPILPERSSSLDCQYLEYSIRVRPQVQEDPFEGLNVLQMAAMVAYEEYQAREWRRIGHLQVLDSTTAFDEYLLSFQ